MSVVSVDQARRHLNMLSFQHDDELQTLIEVAEQAGEYYTGRVFGSRECVDEFVDPSPVVILSSLPVQTSEPIVCSVDGDVCDWSTVTRAGLLKGDWSGSPLTVTYTAGYTVQPVTDVQGVLEMLRHLWETQRGQLARIPDDGYAPGSTFSIPRRVQELWGLNVSAGFA